jgi:hypothetical protein
MRLHDVGILRGSTWLQPFGLKRPRAAATLEVVEVTEQSETLPLEFDEDGRRYVFRFARRVPQRVTMDRDRLFAYKSILPDESVRAYLRDLKNRADFYTEIRELQTHPDVIPVDR